MDLFKPYLYAAFVIGGLALLGGIYAKGQLDAKHKAAMAQKDAQITELNRTLERWRVAAEIDAKQAQLDQKDADLDAGAAKEILDDLSEPDSPALDAGTADRLRDFAKRQHKAGAPAPAR